jgi:hypothetical protein
MAQYIATGTYRALVKWIPEWDRFITVEDSVPAPEGYVDAYDLGSWYKDAIPTRCDPVFYLRNCKMDGVFFNLGEEPDRSRLYLYSYGPTKKGQKCYPVDC